MGRPKKPKPPEPSDDEIRDSILRYLHERHKSARSADASFATAGEIKKAMKPLGVMEKRIVSNLLYIVQNRWVEEKSEAFTVYQKGRPFPVSRTRYRIAAAGIDRFEGASAFQRVDRMAGINITNIQGVTVVGHDNVVRVRFEGLFRDLDALGTAIRGSSAISDPQKLSYQTDIDTIRTQLAKEEPDKGILHRAWDALKGVATLGGVAALFERVRVGLEPLLH